MKWIISSLMVITTLFSLKVIALEPGNPASLGAFERGTHYEVIRETSSTQPQLTEHFSLYCVHCFQSESLLNQLKANLADNVSFNRSHVIFLPQSKPKWASNMTFAFAAARALKIEDKIVTTIFDYHFNHKLMLGEIDDLRDIFSVSGISKQQFDQTISSPEVLTLVETMVASAKNDRVRFTPDLIVNNKYRVLLASVSKSEFPEQELTRLIKYLLTNP